MTDKIEHNLIEGDTPEIQEIKIFTLERYSYDPDGDLALDEVIGSFRTKEKAEQVRDEDIKRWHWSCHVDKSFYEIEEGILDETRK